MKRAKFSLSHYKLLTCKMGQLVPVTWFEALPGDTIQQACSALIRCAPLVTPVMHPVQVRFHHWFVPNRVIWTNWENFITGGGDGMDATAHPYCTTSSLSGASGNNAGVSTLADHLGVPTSGLGSAIHVNALPFRAYDLIWNEFYRDQDLQTLLTVSLGDGSDSTTSTALQNISWEKDYLTSSRPWEQKGPQVTVPVGGQAPVTGIGVDGTANAAQTKTTIYSQDGAPAPSGPYWENSFINIAIKAQSAAVAGAGNIPQVFANLALATGVDINTVRHAFAMQRWQEARARYGSRYTEYLRYLGVRSSDARLQRPEYLGGGRNVIQFSEVLQTAPTSAGTAGGAGGIGQFGGHGIAAMRSNRYRRFFEEHGIVMTLMSVRPKTMYSQRSARAWFRGQAYNGMVGTKEDYWQRELQHIGQQQSAGWEADAQVGNSAFGYQDRYDEYRRFESSVAGLFRSTLDTWHLSREFGSSPSLNSTFVSCVPSTRIFADTSNDNLYIMANHSIQARRLLTREGTSMTF
jgi:hypothetical protein